MPDATAAPPTSLPGAAPPHALRWLLLVVGAPTLVLLGGALAVGGAARARAATEEAARARQVVRTVDALLLRLVDADAGARGYVATGDARFLEPTRRARGDVAWGIGALRRLAGDDGAAVERVAALEVRTAAALDHLEALVRAEGGGRRAELRAWWLAQGKARVDAAREAAAALSVAEERRVDADAAAARRWDRLVRLLALLAAVAAAALGALLHRTFAGAALPPSLAVLGSPSPERRV